MSRFHAISTGKMLQSRLGDLGFWGNEDGIGWLVIATSRWGDLRRECPFWWLTHASQIGRCQSP